MISWKERPCSIILWICCTVGTSVFAGAVAADAAAGEADFAAGLLVLAQPATSTVDAIATTATSRRSILGSVLMRVPPLELGASPLVDLPRATQDTTGRR